MNKIGILIDNIDFSFINNQNFIEITVNKISQLVDKTYIITNKENYQFNNIIKINFNTSYEFLEYFEKNYPNSTLIIINSNSPLLDIQNTTRMIEEHLKYVFDYTYPENIPDGLLPEIINTNIFCFIKNSIPKNLKLFKNSIKEIFESDISSYDTNIFITESELIKYKINFIPDNYNNYLIIKEFIEKYGINTSIENIEEIVKKYPEIIRKRPTYFEIELTTERENCEFFVSNRLTRNGEMDINNLKIILDQISQFSKNPVVSFGLYGEPFLYTYINNLIKLVNDYNEIKFIFESRCIFNNTEIIESFISLDNIYLIFDLSFASENLFKKNKKTINEMIITLEFEKIEEFLKKLLKSYNEKIYLQFTRTTINENELMQFYNKWKDFTHNIIIKKPDIFGGILENYRVVDLSPIKRFPCLHLKHDMVIHYNGNIPLCREDFNCDYLIGNIIEEGIENCWNKLLNFYKDHINNNFLNPQICMNCDEWWVFNF